MPNPTILSCGDSPIVGILTFALGLLATYIALQSATRGTSSEIASLVDDLRTMHREINRVVDYIFDDTHNAPVDVSRLLASATPLQNTIYEHLVEDAEATTGTTAMQGLYNAAQALLGNCVRLFYGAVDLLKRSESDVSRWDPERLRRHIICVRNRHEVAENMSRLEEQKQKLGDVRVNVFLWKSAMQDALLKHVAESVKEMHLRQLETRADLNTLRSTQRFATSTMIRTLFRDGSFRCYRLIILSQSKGMV